MATYTKTNWQNLPNTTTPINANNLNKIENALEALYNMIYPVGSIYLSVNSTNPSTLFGGTWVAWGSGRVPVGVDTSDTDFDTVEETGGSKTVTLTEQHIPEHSHFVVGGNSGSTEDPDATHPIANYAPSGQSDLPYSLRRSTYTPSTGKTSTSGGGQAHNNLQPYITCYMWKRTA